MFFFKIKNIFNVKYSLRYPKKNDILIYDDARSGCIKKYLKNYTVYFTRRYYHTTIIYLPILLECLIKFNLNFSNYKKYFITHVKPKVIITSNDNHLGFYKIKNIFPKIKIIAIQGFWKFDVDHDIIFFRNKLNKSKLKCDYFFCYNKYIVSKYKKFINCENFIDIGSFESNTFPIKKKIKKGSITFISQFKINNDLDHWHDKYTMGDHILEEKNFLQELNKSILNGKKIKILAKTKKKEEYSYYKNIFGNNFQLIPRSVRSSSEKKKIFNHLDQSEIIITLDSTLGYEALARGKKVIFFSIRKNLNKSSQSAMRFCWPQTKPQKGLNWTTSYKQTEINRLFKIRDLSKKKWNRFLQKEFKGTLSYDPNNLKFLKLLSNLKVNI